MSDFLPVMERAAALVRAGRSGAMATVIGASGSTPQVAGARLLLTDKDETVGTVGGGAVEARVLDELQACRSRGTARTLHLDLGKDLGMCCGGRMAFFIERVEGKPRLVIFGAGHVAEKVAPMAHLAGFRVCVVDDRELLCSVERFPDAKRIVAEPVEAADELDVSRSDWLLISTHDHHIDERCLNHYGRGPHRYIGLIGSKRKVLQILKRIAVGEALPDLSRVYAPVGLPIGGASPGEIAASVVAELVALRNDAAVPHLRLTGDASTPE